MSKNLGFTMAEILLSLTIIGVVAAITLPSLMANINERTWNTQRKALYARMSQAIAMMPQIAGYGTLTGTLNADGTQEVTEDTAAETFLTEGLSKVLKINNICDSEHLADCGLPDKVLASNGSVAYSKFPKSLVAYNYMFAGSYSNSNKFSYHQLDTKAAAFETVNGESIAVYYNPQCVQDPRAVGNFKSQPYMCANFMYDLNGNKGPNTAGKDIGAITVLYSTDPVVVSPIYVGVTSKSRSHYEVLGLCKEKGDDVRLQNREEAMSLFVNWSLWGLYNVSGSFWTTATTEVAGNRAWLMALYSGGIWNEVRTYASYGLCVRR